MFNKIKNRIDNELSRYFLMLDRLYSLNKISPLLFKNIKDFTLRKGKRIRPILFIVGYLGFAKKSTPGLYTSALSLELIHAFLLVHDDIIDKSDKRRGKPSMHNALNSYLNKFKNIKFTGQDLTIAAADIMFAMAIHAFLSIKENRQRKEKALRKLIEAAIYTGTGEFIELLNGIKNIEDLSKNDIYKIYNLKTAYYTFACPLSAGAILAGASPRQIDNLFKYGMYLGRAFQIKDDILGMFGNEKKIGKSTLTDLQEAKKTLLIWYAYNNSVKRDRLSIKRILAKNRVNKSDLLTMRRIIRDSGALDSADKEISGFIRKANELSLSLTMRVKYRKLLSDYTKEILSL
jgi:geranylgeranyl diphosphate synthase type I